MAATSTLSKRALSLRQNKGQDAEGNDLFATKSVQGIYKQATADQLYTCATAIQTLYSGTLTQVSVVDTSIVANEEG